MPADRDMAKARKFEWISLEVLLNGLRALYDRSQFANAIVQAVSRLPTVEQRGHPPAAPAGARLMWIRMEWCGVAQKDATQWKKARLLQAEYQEERRQKHEDARRGGNGKGGKGKGAVPVIQDTEYTWVGAGSQQRSLAVDNFDALERIKELEAEKKALALELQLAEDLVGMN